MPVIAPVPLPWRRPVSVVAPVPPFATVSALPRVRVPIVANCEKRFVDDAVVEKKLVVVPAVSESVPAVSTPRFAFVENRFVDEAVVEKKLVVVALVKSMFAKFDSPVTFKVPVWSPPAKVLVLVLVTARLVSVDVPAVKAAMVVVAMVTEPSYPTENTVSPVEDAASKRFPVCPATPLRESVGCVVEPDWLEMYVDWLNSKRSSVEFHARIALGTTVPRKNISDMSSVSAVALSELRVKVLDCVPPMVVEAAEILLAVRVPT